MRQRRRLAAVTKREPDDPEGVDPELEDLTASLLDRWQALKDAPAPDPDSATVSRLDEARARRDGPARVEPPLAETIPLPVREPSPEPESRPPDEGVRRPKHAALRTFPPTERATDSVTASREVMEALGTGPTSGDPSEDAGEAGEAADSTSTGSSGSSGSATPKPRSARSRRAPRHAAESKPPRLLKPSWRRSTGIKTPEAPEALQSTASPAPEPTPPSPATPAADATPGAPVARWHPPSRPVTPRAAAPAPDESAKPVEPGAGRSLNVEFAPKLAARRIVGLLLLVLVAATVAAAIVAYADPRPLTLGAAGTLLALTLAVYAIRAGSAPTHLAIRSGQLEVVRGKTMEKFDLTSRFTRIEVVGTPGRTGWKVLLGRFGRDPLVITGSIVDPKRFMAELERYRPKE